MLAARGEDVLGAGDVGLVVAVVVAPDAGFGGDVEDLGAAGDGALRGGGVGEVAADLFNAETC